SGLLVEFAADHKGKNFTFTLGERGISVPDIGHLAACFQFFPANGKSVFYFGNQLRFAAGLGEKTDGAGFDGANGGGNISVAGEENYRDQNPLLQQKVLHLQPIDAWQSDVQDKADDLILDLLLQEFFRACK